MKKGVNMLTEIQVKAAKADEKSCILRDIKGLYLRFDTSGNKYWILRYLEQKKERQISIGSYLNLSLKDACSKRDEIHTARAKEESPVPSIGHSP